MKIKPDPIEKASDAFRALGDDTRLRLLRLFLASGTDLCVCEMVSAVGLPQYHVSRHLAVLKQTGFLRAAKKGTWMYYSLAPETPLIVGLLELLKSPIQEGTSNEDRRRLEARLALRSRGECVVGTVDRGEINRLIGKDAP